MLRHSQLTSRQHDLEELLPSSTSDVFPIHQSCILKDLRSYKAKFQFSFPSVKSWDTVVLPLRIPLYLLKLFRFSLCFLQSHVSHGTGSSKGKERPRVKEHPAFYQKPFFYVEALYTPHQQWQKEHPILHSGFYFHLISCDPTVSLLFLVLISCRASFVHKFCQCILLMYLTIRHLCPKESHVHSLFLVVPIKQTNKDKQTKRKTLTTQTNK